MPRALHRYAPRLLTLVASALLTLSGCALPFAASSDVPHALPDAQQVAHPLMVGPKNGDLDSFDPALIQFSSDYQLAQLVFPPLLTLDEHNQVAPWAAESWAPSADGLRWAFHLRAGMRWSDGVPITAETYAYSLNRSLDPCTRSGVGYYLSGTGAELIKGSVAFNNGQCPPGQTTSGEGLIGQSIVTTDPQTLIVVLSHPAAYFPMALTYPTAWAQPRHLIEHYGPYKYDPTTFTASGWTEHLAEGGGFGGNLYKVTFWDHAGHLDLVRNERFWGTKPKLREVAVTLFKDQDTAWRAYREGQGDSLDAIPLNQVATAKTLPGYHAEPDATILYLTPNWAIPPFDDVRVRQAFFLALDRRANGRLPTYALITPSIHMVPQGVPGFNPGLRDPAGRVGEAALDPDVARAGTLWQAYLTERFGGDASKAPEVGLCYRAGSQTALTNAEAYTAQWRSAMPGLRVVSIAGCGHGTQVHKATTMQLTNAGWLMDYPDPQDFLSLLAHTGTSYNQSSISLPAADALLDAADANPKPAERLAQYQRAEQLLTEAVAWIPTGQVLQDYLVRPRLGGNLRERADGIAALAIWQRLVMTAAK